MEPQLENNQLLRLELDLLWNPSHRSVIFIIGDTGWPIISFQECITTALSVLPLGKRGLPMAKSSREIPTSFILRVDYYQVRLQVGRGPTVNRQDSKEGTILS